jgi:hypothetical protein
VSQAVPILSYASNEPRRAAPLAARLTTPLVALPAIAVVFLGFAEDTSPWDVIASLFRWPSGIDWQLAYLAFPFFLAFTLFWIGFRRFIWPGISQPERIIAWLSLACATLGTIVFEASAIWDMLYYGGGPKWLIFTSLAVLFTGGLLVFLRRRQIHRDEILICAIYVSYLTNASICVPGFSDHPNTGWYLTLPIAAIMLCRLVLLLPWQRMLHRASVSA